MLYGMHNLSASAGFCLVYSAILKMEAICSSEKSGSLRTTLRDRPENHTLYLKPNFLLHRKWSAPELQRPTGKGCLRKESLFIVIVT
jgi:hypothetical protein